jgi:hypothetical protein
MLDLLIFCDKNDSNLRVDEFAKRSSHLNVKSILFNEGSTKISIYPEINKISINQFYKSIETDAKLYIYHPAFHDNRCTSLYHGEVDKDYESYVYEQWQVVTEYIEFYLENFGEWINKPSASRRAKNKIFQISVAKQYGLGVPKSIITNDAEAINNFIDGDIGIHKSISESGVIDNELVSRTSIFSKSEIDEDSGIDMAPGCFQQFINSDLELRTYVAGNSAMTVVIKPQDKFLIPDIRSQPKNDGLFSISSNFSHYEKDLINLVQSIDLKYAAVDSIVTEQGITFLELNPSGSWEWLPHDVRQFVWEFYWQFILRCLNDAKS